ncbi:MAG TPA: GNAT family N-acetyltransferase [Cellulomonas sp.]
MVEGGSAGGVGRPHGVPAARSATLGAAGVPHPSAPPTFPEVHTAGCRSVDELDEVFGTRGAAAHCWCQFDRMPVSRFEALDDARLRELLAVELHHSPAPGVIATLDGDRVGWCSVGPRSRFPRLRTAVSTSSPATATDDPAVWSVTCFVVRPGYRRRGIAAVLLTGAIDHARSGGAGWLEAYPVDTAGRRAAAADLYRGTLSLFRAAGFEVVARPRPGRAIVRLEL